MAEQSYLKVLINLVINKSGEEEIKYGKRFSPTNIISLSFSVSAIEQLEEGELLKKLLPIEITKISGTGYIFNLKDEYDKLIFKPPV